jgi:hypothetical protein
MIPVHEKHDPRIRVVLPEMLQAGRRMALVKLNAPGDVAICRLDYSISHGA